MADRKGFYHVTDKLREYWQSRGDINTISFGDLYDIDLNKQDIYPLVHVQVNQSTVGEKTIVYDLSIYFANIVDISKQDVRTRLEPSYGNTDIQDVMHNMETIAMETVSYFRRGEGFSNLFQINSDVTLDPFKDAYANGIAGWVLDVDIEVYNSVPIC